MDEVIIDLAEEEEEKNDRGTRRVTARCLSHRSGKRERMLISKSSGSNLRPPRLDRSIYAQALDSMCYEQIREIIVKNAPASRPFPLLFLFLSPPPPSCFLLSKDLSLTGFNRGILSKHRRDGRTNDPGRMRKGKIRYSPVLGKGKFSSRRLDNPGFVAGPVYSVRKKEERWRS